MKILVFAFSILISCAASKVKQAGITKIETNKEYCLYLNKKVKELTLNLKPETVDTLPIRSYIRLVSGIMIVLKNKDIIEIYPKFQKNDELFLKLKAAKVDYRLLENLTIRKIRYSKNGEIVEECGE